VPGFNLFTHIAFAFAIFLLSVALTVFMIHFVRLMDVPNNRSSHAHPVPKSGGVGIVLAFLAGCLTIYFGASSARIDDLYFWGFFLGALGVAVVSLIDDVTQKSFLAKIYTQVLGIGALLVAGGVLSKLSLPMVGEVALGGWGYAITFIWMLGLANSYNFMDGLDGLAGGVGAIAACFLCAIAWSQNSYFVYMVSYALAASIAGFLCFNFPPARIFMGDVGSAFIGFVFAALAVIGASFDFGHLSFYIVPLLLFHFIFDTLFTFMRRVARGEKFYVAHRSHLYQLLNRMGYGHRTVALYHYGVTIAQGIGAFVLVQLPPANRALAFVPFLAFQSIYAWWVLRRAMALRLL